MVHNLFTHWLPNFHPLYCYIIIAVIGGLESTGLPFPGEFTLITSVVIAISTHSQHSLSPYIVALSAAIGAIIGDNCGFLVGKLWGKQFFGWLEKKFPKHFNSNNIDKAQVFFQKHGIWTVFFGRFIALLRILAAPLAGSLKVKYWQFFLANAAGGIAWSYGTTWLLVTVGQQAEKYIGKSSWVLFIFFFAISSLMYLVIYLRKRQHKNRQLSDLAIFDHDNLTADSHKTADNY